MAERDISKLRPWRPGQSGNPAGPKKGAYHVREALQLKADGYAVKALDRLNELIDSDDERVALDASKAVVAYVLPQAERRLNVAMSARPLANIDSEELVAFIRAANARTIDAAAVSHETPPDENGVNQVGANYSEKGE